MIESPLFCSVVRALGLYRGDRESIPSEGTGNFFSYALLCYGYRVIRGGLVRDWTIVLPKEAFCHHKMMTSFKGGSVMGQDIYIR